MTNCMSDPTTPSRTPATARKRQSREERLAAALRTNLRRRKAERSSLPDDAAETSDGDDAAAQTPVIPASEKPRDGS